MILGHSFIRLLHEFVRLPTNALREDFDITTPMNLHWHGIGGRTVAKVIRYDLEIVRQFSPDIVILQLGTNDISDCSIHSALTVGSQLKDLTKLLHEQFSITVVCVCQTILREKPHLKRTHSHVNGLFMHCPTVPSIFILLKTQGILEDNTVILIARWSSSEPTWAV